LFYFTKPGDLVLDPMAPSISSFTKKEYEAFFKDFFTLAHENSKPTATMAFLNADWRDFESTPAAQKTNRK